MSARVYRTTSRHRSAIVISVRFFNIDRNIAGGRSASRSLRGAERYADLSIRDTAPRRRFSDDASRRRNSLYQAARSRKTFSARHEAAMPSISSVSRSARGSSLRRRPDQAYTGPIALRKTFSASTRARPTSSPTSTSASEISTGGRRLRARAPQGRQDIDNYAHVLELDPDDLPPSEGSMSSTRQRTYCRRLLSVVQPEAELLRRTPPSRFRTVPHRRALRDATSMT